MADFLKNLGNAAGNLVLPLIGAKYMTFIKKKYINLKKEKVADFGPFFCKK